MSQEDTATKIRDALSRVIRHDRDMTMILASIPALLDEVDLLRRGEHDAALAKEATKRACAERDRALEERDAWRALYEARVTWGRIGGEDTLRKYLDAEARLRALGVELRG